jgi:hypothetical protein
VSTAYSNFSVRFHKAGGSNHSFVVVLMLLLLAYLKARSPELVPLLGLDMSVLSPEELTGTTDAMMIAQLDGL